MGDNTNKLKVDLAHSYAIQGFGKDDLASAIVFLAVRCRLWGNGDMQKQFDMAFDSFMAYCKARKKTSSILEFSKAELKIASLFGYMVYIFCVTKLQTPMGK